MRNLIENERKIISLARQRGTISKPGLCQSQGIGCGWATAAKLVDRLLDAGVLIRCGTQNVSRQFGKNAIAYGLNPQEHLTLGIDVEKGKTTAVPVSLDGRMVCAPVIRKTPRQIGKKSLMPFLADMAGEAIKISRRPRRSFNGIGVGVPVPIRYLSGKQDFFKEIGAFLRNRTKLPCACENNMTAYCEFVRQQQIYRSFCLIAIRTGIGGGVVLENRLYRGQGYAGEIGHLNVGGNRVCACGRAGCLETEAALPAMVERYNQLSGTPLQDALELMDLYGQGNGDARRVVDRMAAFMARAVDVMNSLLDLPLVVVAGQFGESGRALCDQIRSLCTTGRSEIQYCDIGEHDLVLSSALLIQRHYFF